jgi:predicted RNA binding protein YcfA (HicA-like mRNA interferase family)
MKVRDVLKRIKQDGGLLDRTEGSHRQFRHPIKSGQVTVSGHPGEEVHLKTQEHLAPSWFGE